MPNYEFRCRQCGATFVENRPMQESNSPAMCPAGHDDTVRLLNVAAAGRSSTTATPASGGGCCGGSCGCG